MKTVIPALLFVVVGCAPTTAVVNGQRLGRPTLAYTDHYYYAVTHFGAYPESRGPSSGLHSYGGRVAGFACGADFHYESDFRGRYLQLIGYVQPKTPVVGLNRNQRPARVEVRDGNGERRFNGTIGDDIAGLLIPYDRASRVIDFAISADGLYGQVGSRRFALSRVDADRLAGELTISTGEVLPFELRGLSSMWSMPAADQAAILPFMLTCSQVEEGRHVEGVTTETTAPLNVVDLSGGT